MIVDWADILIPVIAALASLTVAVIALISSVVTALYLASSNKRLAVLTSRLRVRESAWDARRGYEYDARKRLYAECEPLLFQFFELAEDAESRVRALARESRDGSIKPDGSGWMERDGGYYFDSTVYRLIAPMAAIRILQRRVTAVDLVLDRRLSVQYRLLRFLYRSFTESHDLAEFAPEREYKPDKADPGEPGRKALLRRAPEVYARQGFYRGTLDRLVDSLVIRDRELDRVVSFGEFLGRKASPESDLARLSPAVAELFLGFHPLSRPVLWRALVAQKIFYDTLAASRSVPEPADLRQLVPPVAPDVLRLLDWRGDRSDATDEAVRGDVDAARAYVIHVLGPRDQPPTAGPARGT